MRRKFQNLIVFFLINFYIFADKKVPVFEESGEGGLGSTGNAIYYVYSLIYNILKKMVTLITEIFISDTSIFNEVNEIQVFHQAFISFAISLTIIFFLNKVAKLGILYWENKSEALAPLIKIFVMFIISLVMISNNKIIMQELTKILGKIVMDFSLIVFLDISHLRALLYKGNFMSQIFIGLFYLVPTFIALQFSFLIFKEIMLRSIMLMIYTVISPIYFSFINASEENLRIKFSEFVHSYIMTVFELVPIFLNIIVVSKTMTYLLDKAPKMFGTGDEILTNIMINTVILAVGLVAMKEGYFKRAFDLIK